MSEGDTEWSGSGSVDKEDKDWERIGDEGGRDKNRIEGSGGKEDGRGG